MLQLTQRRKENQIADQLWSAEAGVEGQLLQLNDASEVLANPVLREALSSASSTVHEGYGGPCWPEDVPVLKHRQLLRNCATMVMRTPNKVERSIGTV